MSRIAYDTSRGCTVAKSPAAQPCSMIARSRARTSAQLDDLGPGRLLQALDLAVSDQSVLPVGRVIAHVGLDRAAKLDVRRAARVATAARWRAISASSSRP